jgi:hypothetical protein
MLRIKAAKLRVIWLIEVMKPAPVQGAGGGGGQEMEVTKAGAYNFF